jgi:uncharacterized membrane protein YfcA
MMKLVLFFCVFLAAFVDSIAGGGGLISLPAYYAVGIPPHVALGTNKFSATIGTLFASVRFIKNKSVEWKAALVAGVCALAGSAWGANMALLVSERYLQMVLLVLVPILAVFVMAKKDMGEHKEEMTGKKLLLVSVLCGLLVGAYDGFFGPAAGTFYTLAFASIVGMTMTKACGTTKIVNLCSGMAALVTFIINGKIDYSLAIPCTILAIAGNWLGSGLAIKNGAKLVRPVMVAAMVLLLLKIGSDLFMG